MQITRISRDKVLKRDNRPHAVHGQATFDDGSTWDFYATFGYAPHDLHPNLSVRPAGHDPMENDPPPEQDKAAARDAILKHLGFDAIAEQEKAAAAEFLKSRIDACTVHMRTGRSG